MSGRTTTLPPRTTAGASRIDGGVVPDRPGDDAVDELEIGVDQRNSGRGLGADGPQRPEPDGEVADLGGVALDDVEGRALAAEEVAVDRGREQRATRQRDLVRAARRREDAEVDLGRAFRRVRRAADDRDLVDDDVAAAQGRPVDVRADGEDRDQDRHRDPRPLALVEALEHEVVDRADQGDVAEEQEHEAADRRQGERRQVRDRADDLTVVAASDRPARPGRDQVPPEGDGRLGLGDPADGRVDADDRDAAAAVGRVGRHDAVAGGRERAALGELAAERRDVGCVIRDLGEEGRERRRRHVHRRRRAGRGGSRRGSPTGRWARSSRRRRSGGRRARASRGARRPAASRVDWSRRPARRGDRATTRPPAAPAGR